MSRRFFPSAPFLGCFTITFVRGARNAVVGFELSAGRMKDVSFVKK